MSSESSPEAGRWRRRPSPAGSARGAGPPGHWTTELEAIARDAEMRAGAFAWAYEQSARGAKRWGDVLNILSGGMGGIIGTSGLVSIFTADSSPHWSRVLEVVVGYLIGLIAIFGATWRLGEAQMNTTLAQVGYAAVARDIMYNLALPRCDRPAAGEYLQAKLLEIEQMRISAPLISGRLQRRSEILFGPFLDWANREAPLAPGASAQGPPARPDTPDLQDSPVLQDPPALQGPPASQGPFPPSRFLPGGGWPSTVV